MIPIRLSKFFVNIGPIVIFYLLNNQKIHTDFYIFVEGEDWAREHFNEVFLYEYGEPQKLATWMVYIHYAKNILETIFVHRMAGRTIPLNRTLWHILFYWLIFGAWVGYTLFSPLYKSV